MPTFANGESAASVRTKINDAIDKVDGAAAISSINVDGGTIDGVTIGGASAGAGTFTTLTATGDVDIADKIVHTGDTNTAIRFPAADTVTVETAGVEALRINSSQNVGIGTTSPDAYTGRSVLSINGSTGGIITLQANGTQRLRMFVGTDSVVGTLTGALNLSTGDASDLIFNTNSAEKMRLDSSGNVGIGTSSFAYSAAGRGLLEVNGSTSALMGLKVNNVAGGYFFDNGTSVSIGAPAGRNIAFDINGERMRIDSSGNVGVGTASPGAKLVIDGGTSADQLRLGTDPHYYKIGRNSVSGPFEFYGTQSGVTGYVFGGVDGERMRIDSSGNVGIGTSSPGAKLEVNGNVITTRTDGGAYIISRGAYSTSTVYTFWGNDTTGISNPAAGVIGFNTSGSERLRIDSSGNVGIGVTPSAWSPTGTASTALELEDAGPSGRTSSLASASGDLQLSNNAYYDGSGWKYVSATSYQAANYYQSSGSHVWRTAPSGTTGNAITFTQAMTLDASGRLGIGVTSPSAKLNVLDSAAASSTESVGFLLARNGANNGEKSSALMFDVGGGGGQARIYTERLGGAGANLIFAPSDTSGNFQERMRIGNDGRVQIASTNNTGANVKLVVGSGLASSNAITVINTGDIDAAALELSNWDGATASFGPRINFSNSGHGGFLIGASNGSNNFDICRTWGTPDLRIDSSGNLLVGTTSVLSANRKLQVDGASIVAAVFKNSASANEVIDVWNSATSGDNVFIEWQTDGGPTARGTVTYNRTGGLVAYNTTSDYRAKDIAGPIEDASSTVLNLKPYMGTMKGATVERPMFVAHEVQDVAPYAVTGEKDAVDQDGNPKYQQMDHSALVPLLTAALQEALNKIEALEARITALEA